MASASQAIARYAESFGGFEKSAASHDLAWLKKLRQEGFARFSETGFPTMRDEDWRFTNPAAITKTAFHLARNGRKLPSQEALASFFMAGVASRLVFVDGRFVPALSSIRDLPKGVTVANLASRNREKSGCRRKASRPLSESPARFFRRAQYRIPEDGAYVHVPKGVVLEDPGRSPLRLDRTRFPGRQPSAQLDCGRRKRSGDGGRRLRFARRGRRFLQYRYRNWSPRRSRASSRTT